MKAPLSLATGRALCVLIGVIAFSQAVFGQKRITPDAKSFNSHVVSRAPLVYPAIAKAAQIQGTVIVRVGVGTDGEVISSKAISGLQC